MRQIFKPNVMNAPKILFLLAITVFSVLGCNNPAAEDPNFQTVEGLDFTKFKKRKLKLEGTLVFKNPTAFDVQMDAYGFDVYFNGKKVDNVQSKKDHKMKAGELYKQNFVSIVNSKEVLPLVFGKTWKEFDKEEVEVEIKGMGLAKYQNKDYTLDINYAQTIQLSKNEEEEEETASEEEPENTENPKP